jgi:hypothetical protein
MSVAIELARFAGESGQLLNFVHRFSRTSCVLMRFRLCLCGEGALETDSADRLSLG